MGHEYIKENDTFSTSRNGTVPKPTASDVSNNKVLQADGTWVAQSGGGGTVTDVEVDGVSVVNQQGVAEIIIPTPPSVPDELSDLSDVQFSNLTDHQPLRYNATSQKWENGADCYPPLIYSDEEREVGVWRDGKPLYQKTWDLGSGGLAVPNTSFVDSSIPKGDIEHIVSVYGASDLNSSGTIYWNGICAYLPDNASYVKLMSDRNNGNSTIRYITLQYTKTTDTAGSGTWTTQGGYAHHYSTTEHAIGTWIDGKPVYEKVFDNGSDMSISYYGWSSISESVSQYNIKSIINCYGVSDDGSFQSSMLAWNDDGTLKFQTPRNNAEGWVRYFILQYTKTTD